MKLPIAGLFAAAVVLAQTDTTPPGISAISIAPSAVNATSGPATVTIDVTATDDLAGVPEFQPITAVTATAPAALQSQSGLWRRISGDSRNGVYRTIVTIPQWAQPGTWSLRISFIDSVGNRATFLPAQLASLGLPYQFNVTSTPDTTTPVLQSADFSPPSIDVSAADQNVTLTMRFTDDLSGVRDFGPGHAILAVLRSPSGLQEKHLQDTLFSVVSSSPDNRDRTVRITFPMPRYSEPGQWQLRSIRLVDAAGNQRTAASHPAWLTVASSPYDRFGPGISALSVTPQVVNTASAPARIDVEMTVFDDLSGVDFSRCTPSGPCLLYGLILRSPSGQQTVNVPMPPGARISGSPLRGTWRTSATIPRFSETGTWTLEARIHDRVFNTLFYIRAGLEGQRVQSTIEVIQPSLATDGDILTGAGGTVTDQAFGARASLTAPAGLLPDTKAAIDVLSSPLNVPAPRGFQAPGTPFVNFELFPHPTAPLPRPGLTITIPLSSPLPVAGTVLQLFRLNPTTGALIPAVSVDGTDVRATVASGADSITFTGVASLSTVAASAPQPGTVVGDVNGDRVVNQADIDIVRAAFGKREGQAGFDARADLNRDRVIDIHDLALVSRNLSR